MMKQNAKGDIFAALRLCVRKSREFLEKRPFIPLIAILLLAFGLRLYKLDSQSLWWDELKTLERATLSLPDLLTDFINTRDQLPLYYLFMRGWVLLGNNSFILRLFSVMWGVLGSAAVYQLGRQIGSIKVGLIAAFLLAISPFHIYYSQEVRMYTILVTLLILAHVGLIAILQGDDRVRCQPPGGFCNAEFTGGASRRFRGGKRYWLLYFLGMATAVYIHYFTFLILFAHTLFFILHLRPLKPITLRWFGLMVILAALFAPWGLMIVSRSGYSQAVPVWISTVQWYEPILTLWTFTIGATLSRTSLVGIVGFTIFVLGLLSSRRLLQQQSKRQSIIAKLLLLWLFVPLLLIYLISLGNGSFSLYLDRYLIIILPVYLLLVSWGWVNVAKHHTNWLLGLALLATAVTTPSLLNLYNNPTFARNDWQAVIDYIDTDPSGKYLILGHKNILLPITYYGNERIEFIQIPPPESDQMTPAFDEIMQKRLAIAAQSNSLVWHIEPFYIYLPHGSPEQRNALVSSERDNLTQIWLKSHFTLLEEVQLSGIRLTLYDISAFNQ
jgi:mannosyltransferase